MASPVDTSVKFFTSDMVNAAQGFSGTVGSGLTVLRQCLVLGFDTVTLVSLVVSVGVATATFPTVHSAMVNSVVLIAGVTGGLVALNGEQKVVSKVGNTVTFATAAADGTAAGTITMRMAPLGWTEPFSGTNLAVFRAPDAVGTRFFLRIADTDALDMRAIGYESMTGVSAGSNLFPTNAQLANGVFWTKSITPDAVNNPWAILGDGKRFYLLLAYYTSTAPAHDNMNVQFFGDFDSYRSPSDSFNCILAGASAAGSGTWNSSLANHSAINLFFARSHSGAVGAELASVTSSVGATAASGVGTVFGPYPGLGDALYFSFSLVSNSITIVGPRGRLKGLWLVPQALPTGFFAKYDLVNGVGETLNRKLMVMPGATAAGISNGAAICLFDITGPW